MKRVVFDVVMFVSMFILPWWLTAIIAFIGIFVFQNFYEFLVVWAVYYAIYAIPGLKVFASPFWFPVIVCSIFVSIQTLRKYVILYKNEISY